MSSRTVYVVAHGPAKEVAGIRGFDHYLQRGDAVDRMQDLIVNETEGYIFTFFTVKMTGKLTGESVRSYISEEYSKWLP